MKLFDSHCHLDDAVFQPDFEKVLQRAAEAGVRFHLEIWRDMPHVHSFFGILPEARVKPFPLSAEALGNTRANEAIDVRPQITAAVTAIEFAEGQRVEAGDVLVRLESSEPLADLAVARAALVDSQSQFRRAEELYRTRVVSESELEHLEARRDADEAAVRAAESRLAQTVLRAPFAGDIGLRRVSLGSIVNPSTVITTLDDTSRIKLDFDVPEVFISRLQKGLSVAARSAACSAASSKKNDSKA